MNRFFEYISQSRAELTRVAWPNRRQATQLTISVVIFAVIVSAFIGGLDYVFAQVLQKVILKG